jgi:hypothetical protein
MFIGMCVGPCAGRQASEAAEWMEEVVLMMEKSN